MIPFAQCRIRILGKNLLNYVDFWWNEVAVAIQCYCRTFWLWLTLVFLLRNGQHTGSFCTTSTLISLATSLHLGRDLRCHSHRRRSDGIGIFIWPNWWSLVSRNLPKSISFVSQETVSEQKQTGNWSGDVRSHDVLRCFNKSKPRPCWTVGPCTIFVIPVPRSPCRPCRVPYQVLNLHVSPQPVFAHGAAWSVRWQGCNPRPRSWVLEANWEWINLGLESGHQHHRSWYKSD